jgi:hypothetical protein
MDRVGMPDSSQELSQLESVDKSDGFRKWTSAVTVKIADNGLLQAVGLCVRQQMQILVMSSVRPHARCG